MKSKLHKKLHNENCPEEVLVKASKSNYTYTLALVAVHKNCPEYLMLEILKKNIDMAYYIANNISITSNVISYIIHNSKCDLRTKLIAARNKNCDIKDIRYLYSKFKCNPLIKEIYQNKIIEEFI